MFPLLPFVMTLQVNGECVDADRVRQLVTQEMLVVAPAVLDWDEKQHATSEGRRNAARGKVVDPQSEPTNTEQGGRTAETRRAESPQGNDQEDEEVPVLITVSCVADLAEFKLEQGMATHGGYVSFAGLKGDLRERTLALAIAESMPLLTEKHLEQEEATAGNQGPTKEERAEPAPPPEPAGPSARADPALDDPSVDAPTRSEDEMWLAESAVHAGAALRVYPSGVVLFGGALDLSARRFGLSTALLSTGGTVDRYQSAYTNLSVSVSYAPLSVGKGPLRGLFGAKVSGGYTSSDEILRGYVGAAAFAAAQVSISEVWRARLDGEVGHAGWSTEDELRYAQGLYFGTTLALGVSSGN